MRWLLSRVLAVWLISAILCGTVALLVRLNRGPGPLQALGFDVCDGEPCFRGVKPGMDWAEVQKRFPSVIYDRGFLVLTVNSVDIQRVLFQPSIDSLRVDAIIFGPGNIKAYPIMPGELVARYGPPCYINLVEMNRGFVSFEMRYPGILVRYGNVRYPTRQDARLELNMPVSDFRLSDVNPQLCNGLSVNSGPWRGFASTSLYTARNRRSLEAR